MTEKNKNSDINTQTRADELENAEMEVSLIVLVRESRKAPPRVDQGALRAEESFASAQTVATNT